MKTTTPTTYRLEHGTATLGRGLKEILHAPASPRELPFLHVSVRSSRLPECRKLTVAEVREAGPRTGVSYRLAPWWQIRPTEGELSPAAAAQVLPRMAAAKSATEYVFLYAAGPHYGQRHRVLARHNGPTRTVTIQHITSGDIVTVPACDTAAA